MFTRRRFLQTTTAAAGSILAPSVLKAAAIADSTHLDKIGVQLFSLPRLLEQDFAGALKMLAAIGYKELEFFGPYPFSAPEDHDSWNTVTPSLGFKGSGYFGRTAKEVKAILDDNGLTTPAMHVYLPTLRKRMGEMAEAAHTLGQQYAGISAIPQEERKTLDDYKRIADEFNEIGKKAQQYGIRFYYHNHGYGLQRMDGIVPFDLILERTDPQLVFLEMDLYWTTAGGADPVKYLDVHAGRYKLMHVKDMQHPVRFSGDGGDPKQWIALFPYMTDAGSGVLDLKTILSHAKKTGVEHFIVEQDLAADPKASLTKSYTYLSHLELKA